MAVPLKYNLRNLSVRWVTSLLTVLGISLVTVVFVMIFAMGLGIERSLVGSGDPLLMITLRTGTTAESQSIVTKQQYEDFRRNNWIPPIEMVAGLYVRSFITCPTVT